MEQESLAKKILVYNMIEFLTNESNSPALTDEKKESIEVAIQCLETAYEISSDDRAKLAKVDLLSLIKVPNEVAVSEEQIKIAEEHKNLGNNAMKNGNYQEAINEYTKAIEANPKNAVYFCNRAAAFSRLDNNKEAIKDCKQALILDPNYGKAYGRLGIAYSNLNMWAEAVKAYETALQFDPDNTSYQTNLQLANERLINSVDSAAPPQHRPIDISQFINNESFLTMAQEMMTNPDFQNIMSGIMAMSQSGDTNLEALFQAGQNLASHMQNRDPEFVESFRRRLGNNTPGAGSGDASNIKKEGNGDGNAGKPQ